MAYKFNGITYPNADAVNNAVAVEYVQPPWQTPTVLPYWYGPPKIPVSPVGVDPGGGTPGVDLNGVLLLEDSNYFIAEEGSYLIAEV